MQRARPAPRQSQQLRRLASFALLSMVLASMAGCMAISWAQKSFFPQKVKALYTLTNQSTLVLIEDPKRSFDHSTVPDMIADDVRDRLIEESILSPSYIVSNDRLVQYRTGMGESFARQAIDKIGRDLNVRQVIYVNVLDSIHAAERGLSRTGQHVRMSVKVIDTARGDRLFPNLKSVNVSDKAGGQNRKAYVFTSTLRDRVFGNDGPGNRELSPAEHRDALARRVARDITRIFHDYVATEK